MPWKISQSSDKGKNFYNLFCTTENKMLLINVKKEDLINSYGQRMRMEAEEYMKLWISEVDAGVDQ